MEAGGHDHAKYGKEPSALIESLHTVQGSFGYLDEVALRNVAQSMRVPYSRVYGRIAIQLELRNRDGELLDQVWSN